ncbi:transcription initiation factor TFIID subunit 12-like isoform X2 [Varroa jacobsoni]|uniref:Transcription initiation factor TFIID subunit 12 n=2 Tax=Varroa TaxID=62624 RepID=A0A7M7JHJ9_VARDE|nr:transcription initiation factor TFIID subunit 12-like [Varroa destructor]XP_022652287.1 transcription initiation factor TFIID subunit 12-like [Varroa destructor]XP_022686187.1 transcription initiation factor TFIID subunit 12-like isoform X2 [Varroa jacobsoni]XP_022686188.1 transcription initiation factor TFIID subunit 12-like isoform X2 [Varroa jacobsoni]XP_022686189.1 transcription initiation factor TFIID subunit 12-like isoform X2 [Varroa jacobsoni]XP_022686190.1 transcription initiation 
MSLPSSHIVVSSAGPIFSAVSTFPQATVVSSNPTMVQLPVTALSTSGGTLVAAPVVARRSIQTAVGGGASPATLISTAAVTTSAIPTSVTARITNSPQVVTLPLSTLQAPLRPLAAAPSTPINTSSSVRPTSDRSVPASTPISAGTPTISTAVAAPPAGNAVTGAGGGAPKSESSSAGPTSAATGNAGGGNTSNNSISNNSGSGGSSSGGSGSASGGSGSNSSSSGAGPGGANSSSKQQQQERARQERAERDKEKEKDQHDQENKNDDKQILNREKLTELVKEVDPMQQLDEEVEGVLLQLADDFIESVVSSSCLMAKHRKSQLLEAKDVSVVLERQHNLYIPGFGGEDLHTYKKTSTSEAHKQRLALIRKTLKKF